MRSAHALSMANRQSISHVSIFFRVFLRPLLRRPQIHLRSERLWSCTANHAGPSAVLAHFDTSMRKALPTTPPTPACSHPRKPFFYHCVESEAVDYRNPLAFESRTHVRELDLVNSVTHSDFVQEPLDRGNLKNYEMIREYHPS